MKDDRVLCELERLGITCLQDLEDLGYVISGSFDQTTICGLLDWLYHHDLLSTKAFRSFISGVKRNARGLQRCA